MSPFYSLIQKSVGALADRQQREAIYERSRNALREMQKQDSRFTPEEISTQTRDLEAAIARVETKIIDKSPAPDPIPDVPAIDVAEADIASADRAGGATPTIVTSEPKPEVTREASRPSASHAVPDVNQPSGRPDRATRDLGQPSVPQKIRTQSKAKSTPANDLGRTREPQATIEDKAKQPSRLPRIAAAALVLLLVPVGLWLYLRASPRASQVAPSEQTSQPAKAQSVARLRRGTDTIDGSASWQPETMPGAEARSSGFRVEASFKPNDFYASGLRVTFSISGNTQKEYAAAQIGEIRFTSLQDQPVDVKAVAGVLLRKTDSDTTNPLLGLTEKSAEPGLFIMGTSAVPADAKANSDLLSGSRWFDIPFVGPDGTAATVSISMGENNTVMQDALNTWGAVQP